METLFYLRRFKEAYFATMIAAAGGTRLPADTTNAGEMTADFSLGNAVIELKSLDEEPLEKPERQAKLAAIFREFNQSRPVIVLDRSRLPPASQHAYDRALEGPIKTAVAKARRQLKQSRQKDPSAQKSILFLANNGNTALNHEELVRLAAHRVRQDTREIDGIVVAGCYFHSDSFDYYSFWPIDYIPINGFESAPWFEELRKAWHSFAEKEMTELIRNQPSGGDKGPVIDLEFEVDGVTYIKPAPPIGGKSDFFKRGRPRNDSSGAAASSPVAITHPKLTREEWERFRAGLPHESSLRESFEAWQEELEAAHASGKPDQPFVTIPVTYENWARWCAEAGVPTTHQSMFTYANDLFGTRALAIVKTARERTATQVVPLRLWCSNRSVRG